MINKYKEFYLCNKYMYNCTVIITYNYYDKQFKEYNENQNIDLSIIDEDEMIDDISDSLYKVELLRVFDLEEFDELVINKKVNELCAKLSEHSEFSKIMLIAAGKMLSEDLCTGLMLLFSYHTFFLVHLCICDYLNNGKINLKYLNNLR